MFSIDHCDAACFNGSSHNIESNALIASNMIEALTREPLLHFLQAPHTRHSSSSPRWLKRLTQNSITHADRNRCLYLWLPSSMGCNLSLIHISEPTRRTPISYAVF